MYTLCKTWEVDTVPHLKELRNLFWELLLVIVREGTSVTGKFNQHLNVGKFWMLQRKEGRTKAIFLNVWEREDIRVCLDG